MKETIFVKGAAFDAVEVELRQILKGIDQGDFDTDLKKRGIVRDPKAKFADSKIEEAGQGASPDQWMEIIATFGPVAALIGKDVWEIVVVPKLKRIFRADGVSHENPRKKKK